MGIENGPNVERGAESDQINKMEALREQGIVAFDVGLTPEETESIKEVRIEKELPQFDYYGPVNEELTKSLVSYFDEMGENSDEAVRTISALVARIAATTLKDLNKESAWVMVRVSLPNNDFDIPRWHPDGAYFQSSDPNDRTYKLVKSIKGPLTRFGEKADPEKFEQLIRESTENYERHHDNAEAFNEEDVRIRQGLDAVIQEIEPAKEGDAVYYLVGDREAKIHSEPKIDEPRIFMSVVAGSNEQVEELEERWSKE
jgi:hypothetical protein